jgi:Fe-S oxidoreductase
MKLGNTETLERPAAGTQTRSGYGAGEAPQWDYFSKCIHCGLCLNSCPTYRELGVEMDSPRGRIYQMIQVQTGRLPLGDSFAKHIDLCLNCRACETACPSGVEYGRLVEVARGQIERYRKRPPVRGLLRKIFYHDILPHQGRLELVGRMLRFYQRSGLERLVLASRVLKLLPGGLDRIASLAPRVEKPFFTERLGAVIPAKGQARYRVGLLAGCIGGLSFTSLNEATIRVLTRNGCEVVIPRGQGCCGALHTHAGMRDIARRLARQNIASFGSEKLDAIVTNAAGCGAMLKEYPLLFEEEEKEMLEPAREFSRSVRDITEFLAGIDFNRELGIMNLRATYQDPCHLLHAQRVKTAPRRLLAAIPGLRLTELKENEICCGSAGVYNVTHNELAERLLSNKLDRVEETGAEVVLTANQGCLLQLRAGVARRGGRQRVMHVVELLDEAYRAAKSN